MSERYGTPALEPHITLLGKLSGEETALARQTQALAGTLAPFDIRLLEAAYLKEAVLDDIGRYYDKTGRIAELALYRVDGAPVGWRALATFALGGNV